MRKILAFNNFYYVSKYFTNIELKQRNKKEEIIDFYMRKNKNKEKRSENNSFENNIIPIVVKTQNISNFSVLEL